MIVFSHIADRLRRRPWRRGVVFSRRLSLRPVPVLHEPTWDRLCRLAHLLGTSADDLLGGVYVVEEAPPPRGPLRRAVLAAVCHNADDYPQAEYFDLVTAFLVRAFLEDAGAMLRRARLEVR